MKIALHIRSTIRSVDNTQPDVVEQQVDAEVLQLSGETQLYYREGEGREASDVGIFAQDDNMIILRKGPISYQQIFELKKTTTCQMNLPEGQLDLLVITHQYKREIGNITCQFTLMQTEEETLGDYHLELTW